MANRLAAESSPYLLQHKDNPVDWYPWGDAAFARAASEDKPLFLSIGYSTCHWCHVMERESFENEDIARLLNRDFVAIKVDREERPDVDDIYMGAVQAMTGSGGWPLSVFLTPDAKPFYGGTYFPPQDRFGRPGFATLLQAIAEAWRGRRGELESSASEMLEHLRAAKTGTTAAVGAAAAGAAALDAAAGSLSAEFDPRDGGFGRAPKFPPAMRLDFLTRFWLRTADPAARTMTETTLAKMSEGGLYDQVGGGFHRYSTDARWLVPHFEKMLYDNAMLARTYLVAGRAFENSDFRRIARETLDYLLSEMTPAGGGFFAAEDADSEGEEGVFYVWDPASLRAAVGADAAPIVAARFGVTEPGNFENGQTVLSIVRGIPDLAREFGRPETEIEAVLAAARRALRQARSRRVRPGTDDKLLTDWTSLAISAFALAARVEKEPRYEAAARDAAERILANCRRGRELLHRERGGRAGIPGFSSDYANFVEALLDLYETTFEPRYFREAVTLQAELDARFADPSGGYFLSAEEHGNLIVRPREWFDGATPAAASVAAMNLLRIGSFTGERRYRERADRVFESVAAALNRIPVAIPRLLCALDYATGRVREVVLAGEPGQALFEALRHAVFESPAANRVVAHADTRETLADVVPLVSGRGAAGPLPAAYVCENFACQLPTRDPAALRRALDA